MRMIKVVGMSVAVLLAAFLITFERGTGRAEQKHSSSRQRGIMNEFKKPDPSQLRDQLSAEQFAVTQQSETAILAGGCFWGMEEILRKLPGVLETKVGYSGGTVTKPSYEQICTGQTGHAEAIQVVFDPGTLGYEQLLGYFFRMHDPTTRNQQHNDMGTQYRSAIFYTTDEQKQAAERVKAEVDKSGRFKRAIVTEIAKASEFYPAEDYHQKYLVKNPGGYTCHVLRD